MDGQISPVGLRESKKNFLLALDLDESDATCKKLYQTMRVGCTVPQRDCS